MSITLGVPPITELKPRILVMGVGGAGGNAVNNMIRTSLEGVDFVVANTDAQALSQSQCERRIQLGATVTQGLGAGTDPEVGRAAANEAVDQIREHLENAHMVFLTAGLGGGTGTGATPVIAQIAQEMGILTVAVVTKPFQFEGNQRTSRADVGLNELKQFVDTLIVIPNQNLFRVANEKTTFAEAFSMADNVLMSGVRGITDLMVMPGLINLDFADVKAVMQEMGSAMMGTGEAEGENRAVSAAELAISNPLLDDMPIRGAKGVIVNITGGPDLTLFDVDAASNLVRSEVDEDANIIIGSTFDESLEGTMRVSVFASGINAENMPKRKAATIHPLHRQQAPEQTADSRIDEQPMSGPEIVAQTDDPLPGEGEPSLEVVEDQPAATQIADDADTPEDGGESNDERSASGFFAKFRTSSLDREIEDNGNSANDTPPSVGANEDNQTEEAGGTDVMTAEIADGEESDESPFVAPPPMQPDGSMSDPARVDPFADAAIANARSAEETGTSAPGQPERPGVEEAAARIRAKREELERERNTRDTRGQVDLEEALDNSSMFGGVEREERVTGEEDLEDELEIPAFLRRQAN